MKEIEEAITNVNNAELANKFIADIDKYKHIGNSRVIAVKKMHEKCTQQLGLVFVQKDKKYVAKAD